MHINLLKKNIPFQIKDMTNFQSAINLLDQKENYLKYDVDLHQK